MKGAGEKHVRLSTPSAETNGKWGWYTEKNIQVHPNSEGQKQSVYTISSRSERYLVVWQALLVSGSGEYRSVVVRVSIEVWLFGLKTAKILSSIEIKGAGAFSIKQGALLQRDERKSMIHWTNFI